MFNCGGMRVNSQKSKPCCSEKDHSNHSTKGLHITFVSGSASTHRHGEIGLNDQIWENENPWMSMAKMLALRFMPSIDNVLLTSPSHWKRLFTAVLCFRHTLDGRPNRPQFVSFLAAKQGDYFFMPRYSRIQFTPKLGAFCFLLAD